jgi:hypothetical protein
MTPITKDILRAVSRLPSTDESLTLADYEADSARKASSENLVYQIVKEPEIGRIQFRFDSFYEDLTGPGLYTNKFTQSDIDQGTHINACCSRV